MEGPLPPAGEHQAQHVSTCDEQPVSLSLAQHGMEQADATSLPMRPQVSDSTDLGASTLQGQTHAVTNTPGETEVMQAVPLTGQDAPAQEAHAAGSRDSSSPCMEPFRPLYEPIEVGAAGGEAIAARLLHQPPARLVPEGPNVTEHDKEMEAMLGVVKVSVGQARTDAKR